MSEDKDKKKNEKTEKNMFSVLYFPVPEEEKQKQQKEMGFIDFRIEKKDFADEGTKWLLRMNKMLSQNNSELDFQRNAPPSLHEEKYSSSTRQTSIYSQRYQPYPQPKVYSTIVNNQNNQNAHHQYLNNNQSNNYFSDRNNNNNNNNINTWRDINNNFQFNRNDNSHNTNNINILLNINSNSNNNNTNSNSNNNHNHNHNHHNHNNNNHNDMINNFNNKGNNISDSKHIYETNSPNNCISKQNTISDDDDGDNDDENIGSDLDISESESTGNPEYENNTMYSSKGTESEITSKGKDTSVLIIAQSNTERLYQGGEEEDKNNKKMELQYLLN